MLVAATVKENACPAQSVWDAGCEVITGAGVLTTDNVAAAEVTVLQEFETSQVYAPSLAPVAEAIVRELWWASEMKVPLRYQRYESPPPEAATEKVAG